MHSPIGDSAHYEILHLGWQASERLPPKNSLERTRDAGRESMNGGAFMKSYRHVARGACAMIKATRLHNLTELHDSPLILIDRF